MRRVEKPNHLKKNEINTPDELAFLLWSAELDKEIIAFWKAMIK